MPNYNAISAARAETRDENTVGTPSYEDGWFNGNPMLMIKAGTYDKYRSKLKGLAPEQLDEFDAQNEDAKAKRAATAKAAKPVKPATKPAKGKVKGK